MQCCYPVLSGSEQDEQSLSCSKNQHGITAGEEALAEGISSTCAEGADEGHKQLSKVLIPAWRTVFKCRYLAR